MSILPSNLTFSFGPEEKKLEISCEYSEKQTTFRLFFDGQAAEQVFFNIFGQPTVINILSNRDMDSLDLAYPNEFDRIRFVKGILYVWVAYKLGSMGVFGPFSKLMDKKKLFEDFAHKELLEIVIIPVLRSIRDGQRHLPDMPEAVLAFADISSRELEAFTVGEVDKAEIFEEDEFKAEFKEKLNQVNAHLAIKAVQALSAADIDRISRIGETIEELQSRKVDIPEFESLKEDFKLLCRKMEVLGANSPPVETLANATPVVDHLIAEINAKKETLEMEIQRCQTLMKEIEQTRPATPIPQPRVIVHQPDFSSDTAHNRIMRNMNRKSLKVLDKMFANNDE